jgi:MFS family permease
MSGPAAPGSAGSGVDGAAAPGGAGPTGDGSSSGRKIWGLERNVFWAGVVSFFMDVSSEMVYSLVPIFLSSVLGVNKSLIGLIEGIAETTASMLKMVAGWLSDKLGRRKPLMLFGYGISSLSRPLLALAPVWGVVLGARFVDRFGKGVRTAPRDAIVADSSPRNQLGRSFGYHRAMDQAGAVIGPGIAFVVLAARPGGYRTVFWISMVPAVLSVVVIWLFITEKRKVKAAAGLAADCAEEAPVEGAAADSSAAEIGAAAPEACPPRDTWWQRLGRLRGPLLFYLLVTGVFSLGNSSDAFLILRARDLGIAAVLIPIVYMVFNFVYSALSIPAGIIADRIGRRRVALIGFAVFAVTYAWMALAQSALAAWGVFVLYGVYMGISDGNGRALLGEFSTGARRGTAYGAYHMVVGVAALPASVVAGVLYDHVSPAAPFWVGAGAAVLAGILLLALVPEVKHGRERAGA